MGRKGGKQQYVRVTRALVSMACLGVLLLAAAPRASASDPDVLVFGSADNGVEGDNVASTLTSLGYDVERTAALPIDLTSFSSIWYIEAYQGLTSQAEAELEAYVEGGGSLYLTGERPCCEELNVSDENVVRAVLTNKDVVVGGLGDIAGPFTFNPGVEDEVSSSPNTLVDFVPDSPGGMAGIGGIDSQNVFASNGAIPVGAVFDERDMVDGKGRIAVLMDIDWLTSDARAPIIENIQDFLVHGRGCTDDGPADDPGFAWHAGPRNCSVLTTPSMVSWSASSTNGGVSFAVSANEVDSNCSSSVASGVTTETCSLGNATATANLQIRVSDSVGSVTRRYRVRPKNDPRNVPPGFSLDSNWWEWPDQDQDGVPGYWEEEGVWVDDQYLNLPAFGANPLHKDLFLRYDFEEGQEFDAGVFTDMMEAFDKAPLSNPDGSYGVDLHVDLGDSVPSTIVDDFQLNQADIQKVTAYTGFSNGPEIGGGGVPQIFHWMLNFHSTGSDVIGRSYIGGGFGFTAFPVAPWEAALNLGTAPDLAVDFAQAANATHELGHQLGLHHHGAVDNPNADPRYQSVMSYAYSNFGVPGGFLGLGHRIDYSRSHSINLDWQMGQGAGKLTFVRGQWGEEPDFYSRSANEIIDTSEPKPSEMTIHESLEAAAAGSVEGFVDGFVPGAEPDIPILPGEELAVARGASVDIPLHGIDPASAPLSYKIVGQPALGTAVPIAGGIRYQAPAGSWGEDLVLVRATNGTLSSEAATVAIHISGPPPSSGQPGPSDGAGPVSLSPQIGAKGTSRRRCRPGSRRMKVHGTIRCVKRHRHHHRKRHRS